MIRNAGLGLIILLVALMISPVAACPPPPTIIKTCPEEVCSDCAMTCTISVTFYGGHGSYNGKVVDTLPAGSVYSTSSDSGIYDAGKVTWNLPVTNSGLSKDLTVTFTPPVGESVNRADAKAIGTGWTTSTTTARSSFVAAPCVPEFPALALPVAMLLGFVFIIITLKSRK